MSGPLSGVRVVEFAGIGPGPFSAMVLADMGADVVRIDRRGARDEAILPPIDLLNRGRRSIVLDLKHDDGLAVAKRLVDRADVLVEGFRPGVMERLGLGPNECLESNPRLVYGRVTGYGQDGPSAHFAGHDINYIALSGALSLIGRAGDAPVPPVNFLGDFGGGGMLLAFGVACALLESRASGRGQVIDAAMVDGAALLSTFVHSYLAAGTWRLERGSNLFDTGAPRYDVYETADHRFVAVGALEPAFYAELLERLGLEADELGDRDDPACWPAAKALLVELFATKSRDEWCALLEASDACVAPVLSLTEAPAHPQLRARGTFVEFDGITQPAPAPRFSRTPGEITLPPPNPGEHSNEVLAELGFGRAEITALRENGAIA